MYLFVSTMEQSVIASEGLNRLSALRLSQCHFNRWWITRHMFILFLTRRSETK